MSRPTPACSDLREPQQWKSNENMSECEYMRACRSAGFGIQKCMDLREKGSFGVQCHLNAEELKKHGMGSGNEAEFQYLCPNSPSNRDKCFTTNQIRGELSRAWFSAPM